MRKTSLAHAKAHLSELVDAVEHHGKKVLILRHRKPVAAIVPVGLVSHRTARRPRLDAGAARRSLRAFVAEFSRNDPDVSAVEDLLAGRR